MKYLLDTNTLNNLISDRHGIRDHARLLTKAGHRVGTSVINVAEIMAGLENSHNPDRNREAVRIAFKLLKIWPFEQPQANTYGRIFAQQVRLGRLMQRRDMMMAAVAITLGNCVVVTTDSDLLAIPNLTCENWQAP